MQLPPVHPILVNFTAALVPVSVISDLIGRAMRKSSLNAVGWWTMVYAAVVTPFTALAGWLWLRSMPPMDVPEMSFHKFLGTELAVVFAVLAWWRWRAYRSGQTPSRVYLVVAVLAVAALVVQGHVGGTMSFSSSDTSIPTPARGHGDPSENPQGTLQWQDHIDVKG